MINIAIVGFGFMGRMHFKCYKNIAGVRVAAICDIDQKRFGPGKGVGGNIAGAEQQADLSGVAFYTDFDEMLGAEKLDAVSITLPSYLHCGYSVGALNAGVNVLCEKPMATSLGQCREMIAAAKRNRKILQIGHCIRFWPEYALARELIKSRRYGSVRAAAFRRLSLVPKWSWRDWILDADKSGGAIFDLHIHDSDFIQHMFGMPKKVFTKGSEGPSGGYDHVVTNYDYKGDCIITATGGWIMTASFGFEMGFSIILEKADIIYNSTGLPTLKIYPADAPAFGPVLEKTDGYQLEINHFVNRLKGRKVPRIITNEQSMNSVKLVLAEKRSALAGREVVIR